MTDGAEGGGRRSDVRVDFQARVELSFSSFQGFLNEYATNISRGGMFISSDTPKPPGTVVRFRIAIEQDGEGIVLVQGSGVVVWIRERRLGPEIPPGMGVQFISLDRQSKQLIDKVVDETVRRGGVPFDLERDVNRGVAAEPPSLSKPAPSRKTASRPSKIQLKVRGQEGEDQTAAHEAPTQGESPDEQAAVALEDAGAKQEQRARTAAEVRERSLDLEPEAPGAGDDKGDDLELAHPSSGGSEQMELELEPGPSLALDIDEGDAGFVVDDDEDAEELSEEALVVPAAEPSPRSDGRFEQEASQSEQPEPAGEQPPSPPEDPETARRHEEAYRPSSTPPPASFEPTPPASVSGGADGDERPPAGFGAAAPSSREAPADRWSSRVGLDLDFGGPDEEDSGEGGTQRLPGSEPSIEFGDTAAASRHSKRGARAAGRVVLVLLLVGVLGAAGWWYRDQIVELYESWFVGGPAPPEVVDAGERVEGEGDPTSPEPVDAVSGVSESADEDGTEQMGQEPAPPTDGDDAGDVSEPGVYAQRVTGGEGLALDDEDPTADMSPAEARVEDEGAAAEKVSGLGAVQSIRWTRQEGQTEVRIVADAPIGSEDFNHLVLSDPPRVLIRLIGVQEEYRPYTTEVGGGGIEAIRAGLHREFDPPQLYVVLDLSSEDVAVQSLAAEDGAVRVVLEP